MYEWDRKIILFRSPFLSLHKFQFQSLNNVSWLNNLQYSNFAKEKRELKGFHAIKIFVPIKKKTQERGERAI